MEIINRAKGESGEVVNWDESESNVREEVNRRTCKAGYTNREGGPRITGNIRSTPFSEQGRSNYERIFKHK